MQALKKGNITQDKQRFMMIIQMNIEHSLNRPYHGSLKKSQQLKKNELIQNEKEKYKL